MSTVTISPAVEQPRQPRLWQLLAFRLTVYYGGVLAVAAGATFGLGYAIVTSAMRGRTDADLAREAERCGEAYRIGGLPGSGRPDRDGRPGDRDERHLLPRVRPPAGGLPTTSDLATWTDATLPPPVPGRPADAYGAGHHSRLRVLTDRLSGGVLVQVGVTVQDDQRVVDEVRRLGGLVLLGLMAVAVPIGWVLARRALAGVARVTQTANDISGGAMDHRVPLAGSGDEVDQLAATFNRMLGRIQTVVEGMEETNDNIAHELRSPVTRIRGLAETTLTGRPGVGDYQAMAASTIDECDRLLAMINTMLDIAEAEAGVMPLAAGSVDVDRLLAEVAELFEPVAADRPVTVDVRPGGRAHVRGRRAAAAAGRGQPAGQRDQVRRPRRPGHAVGGGGGGRVGGHRVRGGVGDEHRAGDRRGRPAQRLQAVLPGRPQPRGRAGQRAGVEPGPGDRPRPRRAAGRRQPAGRADDVHAHVAGGRGIEATAGNAGDANVIQMMQR